MRNRNEIEDAINNLIEFSEENPTAFENMLYLRGIKEALEWVLMKSVP
jgi:hypothetical protein